MLGYDGLSHKGDELMGDTLLQYEDLKRKAK